MIRVITVRGTGEKLNDPANMLAEVQRRLDIRAPGKFQFTDLAYPASVGPFNPEGNPLGVSLQQSVSAGTAALDIELFGDTEETYVLGYSLGAYVVSELLEIIAEGHALNEHGPSFVGLLANPRRAPQPGVPVPGQGIAGPHGPWPEGLRYAEIANPNDGITCSNAVLGTVSDQAAGFSLGNLIGSAWSVIKGVVTGRFQPSALDPANPVATAARYARAAELMAGYLDGTQHVGWYRDHIDLLVDAILRAAGLLEVTG